MERRECDALSVRYVRIVLTIVYMLSTADLFAVIAGQLKHLLVCGASLEFMQQEVSAEVIAELAGGKSFVSVLDELAAMRQQIERVRKIVQEIDNRCSVEPIEYIGPECVEGKSRQSWNKMSIGVSGGMAVVGLLLVRSLFLR